MNFKNIVWFIKGKVCMYGSNVAHQAEAYPGFCSMKCLGVFLLHLNGMLVTPSIKFPDTHLYTWLERGIVRIKCLAQEHNTMSRPRLEPGTLAPESSALTMRPPHQSSKIIYIPFNFCSCTPIYLNILTLIT